jgi:hypothetical protein
LTDTDGLKLSSLRVVHTPVNEVPFTVGRDTEGVRASPDIGSPALSAKVLRLGSGSLSIEDRQLAHGVDSVATLW